MPVVGCPKCKKKFKLSNEMLGKTVRCSNCETAFKTAGQAKPKEPPQARTKAKAKPDRAGAKQSKRRVKKTAAADDRPTQASKRSLKDVGLSGQIKPQMDLFAQPIPSKRSPDPLGNFSLEDPGFGNVDLDVEEENEEDSKPEDKKLLFMNPALKSTTPTSGRRKPKGKMNKPEGFKSIKVLGQVVSVFALIGIACCLSMVILTLLNVLGKNTEWISEFENTKYVAGIAFIVLTVANSITYLTSLAFWPLAHANTSTLGAKEHRFSPLTIVIIWFIPLLNLFLIPMGFTEIVKASKKPLGKKWKKSKDVVWESFVWPIALLASPICFYVANANKKMIGMGGVWVRVGSVVIGFLLMGLTLFCILSLVRRITKTQYSQFE